VSTAETALDNKNKTKTNVTTRTLTHRETTVLTREEELVVRMRKGLSEEGDFLLEFRGAGNEEVTARLGLIEANLLADMFDAGPLAAPRATVDTAMKDRIIDQLSKLSD
jgi:hypothetical protein